MTNLTYDQITNFESNFIEFEFFILRANYKKVLEILVK